MISAYETQQSCARIDQNEKGRYRGSLLIPGPTHENEKRAKKNAAADAHEAGEQPENGSHEQGEGG